MTLIYISLLSGESSAAFGFVHPDGGRGDAGHVTYHGVVAEDANEVLFNPPIRTQGELICKFEVVHHHNQAPSPFEVRDNFVLVFGFWLSPSNSDANEREMRGEYSSN